MKKYFILAASIILSSPILAQNADLFACTPALLNCRTNFINEQYTDSQIYTSLKISYKNPLVAVPDVNYYSKNDPDFLDCGIKNIGTCPGSGEALTYDVYCPDISAYSCYKARPLPAVFFFHGGGFSDCVENVPDGASDYCMAFAKRGFVVFNVDYRAGRLIDPNMGFTASQLLAMYRACQDGRGAIKSVLARNNLDFYKIDEKNIFLAGVSAGAQVALNIAYVTTQSMNDEVFLDVAPALGPIDIDYYSGSPAITYSIKGVLNLWGAAFLPSQIQVAAFLNQNRIIPPMIAFQGLADSTLYPTTAKVLLDHSSSFNFETRCLLPLNGRSQTYYLPRHVKTLTQSGSSGLYDVLTTGLNTPVPCELYLDSDMAHGIGAKSDFGFGQINKTELRKYIVQRAATFFQAIANNKTGLLITTKFTDCINSRALSCKATDFKDKNCNSNTTETASSEETNSISSAAMGFCKILQHNKDIKLQFQSFGPSDISIYNLQGARVKFIHATSSEVVLKCTDIQAGIYVIIIKQGNKIQKNKIILF